MDKLKRRYLVYQLMSTLDWMGRSDDWFKRSELVTRTMGIIRNEFAVLGSSVNFT